MKMNDISSICLKLKSKNRRFVNFYDELRDKKKTVGNPPLKNECIKVLSIAGGGSSTSFIEWIALKEKIECMYVSTFRIGKKQFEELIFLYNKKRIDKINFITSNSQVKIDSKAYYKGKEYNYFEYIEIMCEKNKWNIKHYDNHSKLILMKTKDNYYVIETSSNMNENPKMEQFNIENDKSLYEWYEQVFIELMK